MISGDRMTGVVTGAATVEGPLVTGDPGERMWQNIEALMASIADRGAEEARRGFRQGADGRAPIRRLGDRVADHIVGRTVSRASKGGRRWRTWGVIQVYNEGLSVQGGRSLMAAASIVEGRQNVIRKVTRKMGQELRKIDLTKGLE